MKVLYAEDERQLSVAVTEILKMEGFEVTPVYDGQEALDALGKDYFDVVVLDIMMPKKDGIEVLESMRRSGNYTAVLMLTAKATVDDRITGLSSGADDYLAKPFAMKELVARLNSLIRRNSSYRHSTVKLSNIELDSNTCELRSDKGSLRLNNPEAEVLTFLIRHVGEVYTAEQINEQVWQGKESPEKAELYVFYLKNKLRQIHSKVNVQIENDTYRLCEETL
ncbi:MAG: response regulator transcription factor [Ruminococcus sp.]|nr:response regulator transcription factor [Ruminococcus sp.]MBQ4238644.1 response regulator transcription factor [Ruminococcus sp.]